MEICSKIKKDRALELTLILNSFNVNFTINNNINILRIKEDVNNSDSDKIIRTIKPFLLKNKGDFIGYINKKEGTQLIHK